MELLPLHPDGHGQNFGFILYSTTFSSGRILTFTSLPKDRAQVCVNIILKLFIVSGFIFMMCVEFTKKEE